MESRVRVSSSPHVRSGESVHSVMRDVVIALTPAMLYSFYVFGLRAFLLTAVAILSAVGTEAVIQKMRGKKVTISDMSAVITGLLLAMNMPSSAPLWMVVVGSIFAIAIVKHAFGGLGHNFMNPALAARAFLVASWPTAMTAGWPQPFSDTLTGATPMALLKSGELTELPSMFDAFMGNIGGSLGETSALLLIIGGLYLVYRGVISIRIPAIYIGTVAVLTFVFSGFSGFETMYSLVAGGLMLGAFFMATDYASSPITPKGQIIYALGCGIITTVIRFYGGYPEGVSYSILLMNVATPIIERYTAPKVFGGDK